MIYLIADQHGRVKVGWTEQRSTRDRLSDHQTGNADELILIGEREGGEADEKKLQAALRQYQSRSEWFVLCQAVVDAFWFGAKPIIEPSMPYNTHEQGHQTGYMAAKSVPPSMPFI